MSDKSTKINFAPDALLHLWTMILVTLKLSGAIDWSWWVVLVPVWIAIGLFLVALLVLIAELIAGKK